jgi:type IV secretory pathway protease TraF
MAFREGVRTVAYKWANALQWAVVVVPPLIAFNDNIASIQIVAGRSMSPTLNPSNSRWLDVVYVSKVSDFAQNDVVLMKDPLRTDHTLIVKRVADISRDGTSVYVLGDNGEHSTDSRDFGSVPSHLVQGVVKAIIFPPWRVSSSLSR